MALTTITSGGLGDNSVDTDQLAASAVETAKINNDAVTLAKMASGTDGAMLTYDASGNPVAITGTDGQVATSAGADAVSAFEAAAGGGVSGITSDGTDITITSGDIIFGAAGKGINLGVTSNTDANTLDDYEEGTFTATMTSTGATFSYSGGNSVTGYYTKIGNIVNIVMHFDSNATITGETGNTVSVQGLPFTSSIAASITTWDGPHAYNSSYPHLTGILSGTAIYFYSSGDTSWTDTRASYFDYDDHRLNICATYKA